MTPNAHSEDNREHLLKLIHEFDTAMLVTRTADGALRGRPLTVAAAQADGLLYFSTSVDSPKVGEMEDDQHVAVLFQDARRYVSVSGTARLLRDKALVARLWKESWKVWFPRGKDDPTLAIIEVKPLGAEYWDQTGLAGARYLFAAMKAYATGTKPPDGSDERQNAKVPL